MDRNLDASQSFDPRARAAEKQASRDADEFALASGERSAADLRAENGTFAFPGAEIDWSSAPQRW